MRHSIPAMTAEHRRIIEDVVLVQRKIADTASLIHEQHKPPDGAEVSLALLDELERAVAALRGLLEG